MDRDKTVKYLLLSMWTTCALCSTMLTVSSIIKDDKAIKANEKDILTSVEAIERNIVLSEIGIKDFAFRAVSAYKENSNYFVQLFGQATYKKDENAMLTSVSYNIDEPLYKEIEELLDIEFEVNGLGKVTNAFNKELDNDVELSDRLKAVYEQLVEVTQRECSDIKVMGRASDVADATHQVITKDTLGGMVIENITKPMIKGSNAVFDISVLAEVKEGDKKSIKRISLEVSQPLNEDIKKNTSRCYLNYIKNKNVQTEVKSIEDVGKSNIKLIPEYNYEIESAIPAEEHGII